MPQLTLEQIANSTDYNGIKYYYARAILQRMPRDLVYTTDGRRRPEYNYSTTDFKKVASLLYLLTEVAHESFADYSFSRTSNPNKIIVTLCDNNSTQRLFGCNIASLSSSLSKARRFVEHFIPRQLTESEIPPSIQISVSGTCVRIVYNEFDAIYHSLFSTNRMRHGNFTRRRANMPLPASISIGQLQINTTAVTVNSEREALLNNAYRRDLNALLSRIDMEVESNQSYELSSGARTVDSYLRNAAETFENSRFAGIDTTTQIFVYNAATNFISTALSLADRISRPLTEIDYNNTSYRWSNGAMTVNANNKITIAFKIGREKVETWLSVGNRGPNRNRNTISREIRTKLRQINLLLECFGCSISTKIVRNAEGNKIRLFIMTNLSRTGTRFTIGVNPLAPAVVRQPKQIPAFFKDPTLGIPQSLSNVFNFLLNKPTLSFDEQATLRL